MRRRLSILGTLLLSFPLAAAAAAQGDAEAHIVELFERFGQKREHMQAARALRAQPRELVLPYLIERLRTDAELRASDWVLVAAHGLLLEFHDDLDGVPHYSDPAQIELILDGIEEADPRIRSLCVGATRSFDGVHAREATRRMLPLLSVESGPLAAQAADSLRGIGPEATAALPALGKLLVCADEASRKHWKDLRSSGELHRGDAELRTRTAAASARVAIGGVGIDLEHSRELDWRGQAACAAAIRAPTLAFLQGDEEAEIEERDLLRILILLHDVTRVKDMPLEHQKRATVMLSWACASPRGGEKARAKGLALLRAIREDEDESVKRTALECLERIENAGR